MRSSIAPMTGEEKIISRLAFRKTNNYQFKINKEIADTERKIIIDLAGYLRASQWKRVAMSINIAAIDDSSSSADFDAIALYILEDGDGKAEVRYFSLPIAMEPDFLSLMNQHNMASEKSRFICKLVLDLSGGYSVNNKVVKSDDGINDNEDNEYSKFVSDQ